MEFRESSSKREVYSNTILLQEISKASNRQLSSISKAAGKRRIPQSQQKERHHKDQSRNN